MDFSGNGLGVVTPMSCIVTETLNGEWELTLVHPIDATGKWQRFVEGRILRVPVPAASTPRISMAKVEHIYRVSVKKGSLPLYSGAGKRRKLVRKYNKDTEVVVISQENADWFEVVCPDGRKGYMSAAALTFVRVDSTAADRVIAPRQLRDQPFRIYRIVSELDKITVYARHIFYDLLDNMLREYKGLNIAASTVVQGIASGCMSPHDFSFYSDVADAIGEFQFEHINPIEALLGDEGVVEKTNAEIARDWYDVFLTRRVGSDTGVEIREGKNLLGISYDLDATGVVTRIMPTGQDRDGEILYLPELYIDSPDIGNYPAPKWMHLEVTDAKKVVKGDGKKTKAQCYEEMRKAAQEEFDKDCDRPAVTLKVDFINCADTEEYRQYGFLQNIFLGDTVRTLVKKLGIYVSMRMTQYSYDCMTRKYTSMTLGTVEEALAGNMISSSQIPSGSISGSKLAGNSVGAYQLKAASVVASKIEAGAITTEKLAAGVVTAEKLAAGSVTAEKIAAGAVDAISINAVKARLAEITAEDIETDELAAELARITVLIAGTAAFDAATIRHLVAEAMNLEYGVAGQVFIKNLAVEYAQMVGAAIGKLCIKASDGKYYLLDVGADGRVTATETTVTDGEIEAGQTSGGSVIVETNITAASLTTTNLLATYALINKIDAARIDVDELVGRKIFADALYTSRIYGGKSLELIVGDVEKAQETAGNAATWRVEIISGGGQVLNGASSVTLSAHLYYGETEYTDRISATAFSWRRSSDGDGENSDAVWAATHTGMKQITVSAGDVDYNAVYTCDVDYKHIIDVDYEAFELSGNPVVCEPYADYPLDITAVWAPERVYGNANLLDFDGIILFENSDGCTCEIVGKTVVFGNYANANDRFVCSAWIDVEANTDYSVSCKSASIGQYYIYTDKLFGTLVKAVSNNAPTFNSGNNTRVLIGFYSIKTDRVGDVDTLSEFKVEQGTSVTTYIPYGASCNIVGRASVDVTRCGANILQYTPPASGTLNGIQWTVDGNRISISGTPTADCYILLAGGYGGTKYGYPPMIAPGETYTLSRYTQVYFYKKDGTSIAPRGTTFVAPPSEDVKTYGIFVSVFAADGAVDATIQPTIAVGAQSNPNEVPYTGETKTLVLSHEVYGGTVNADGSCTETWGSIESYAGETLPGEWMSDRGDITSGTAGGTAVPATGAHVVYKLTTPVEMTAAGGGEITALDGVNTILTNADSLTVKGRTNERAVLA